MDTTYEISKLWLKDMLIKILAFILLNFFKE